MSRFLSLIFLLSSGLTFAQIYNFQYISQAKGLTNTFVNDIIQDDRGFLFVSTGEGIGLYNGQKMEMFTKQNHIVDNYITKSYKDKKGNIWFGHIQGGSSIYYHGEFGQVHVGAGIDSQINDIEEDEDGRIWFVAQNYGLYFYTEDIIKDFFPDLSKDKQYYCLKILHDNHFLIGTDQGIEVFVFYDEVDGNTLSKTQQIGNIPDIQIVDIVDFKDKVLAFSNTGKVFEIFYKDGYYDAKEVQISNNVESLLLTEVSVDKDNIWISTFQSGLYKCSFEKDKIFIKEVFNQKSGLKTNAVKTSFVDREGVLWIGTFGEGLVSKEDDIFTYYFKSGSGTANNPAFQVLVNDTEIYLASKGKITHYDKQHSTILAVYGHSHGIPDDQITCMDFGQDSTLYIGTSVNGVFQKAINESVFRPIHISNDNLAQTITDIEIDGEDLFIGTLNGAYRYDLVTGGIRVYNITTGLPHNAVGSIYKAKSGAIYVGTYSAYLSRLTNDEIINLPIYDGLQVVEVNDIHEDEEGDIWFCSNGNGFFKLEENGCKNITTLNGLMSNYCNSIKVMSNNRIWVTHNEGLSKWNDKESNCTTYDEYFGLNERFLRSSSDLFENELWLGTENGLVLYDERKDSINSVPPITSIKYININDSLYDISKEIHLPYGAYKFGFGLSGLTLKGSKKVLFQFILEGYDTDWSAKTDKNSIYYTGMYDGEYIFKVKSFNADGTEGNIEQVKIIVDKPYWKEWWFYLLVISGLILILFSIIKYRERSFIRYQEKLKHDLALRTREVVEQKNKIEDINKDLTDSINYAQRIQSAILPTDKYLKELFPSSLIFFRPRDIVSGDFYWCSEIKGKKILICADCTGHGVPGGFMSMISHILLREALNSESLDNPAMILGQINDSIVKVLKQTDDLDSNRDGLDIAIIVLDESRKLVKFAGAMRPLYLYRNGVRNIIKGDRFSIGGIAAEKSFETKELQVQEGDKLYIFSDGYADQFGGPMNHKMKLKVFQEFLDQICLQPMEEQEEQLKNFFYEWKGERKQMDDILVMGIEI
ncbi:MAG: SpoIIE family protein phosphatase [Flavobacteriales bacterium]|nr:SpoIIE family protein phosphatase [Flavobacteriales bacterium]